MRRDDWNWGRIDLGDVHQADQARQVLVSACAAAAIGGLESAAIFLRHEHGSVHCHQIAYLTPQARAVLRVSGVQACVAPSRTGLSLYVGPKAVWSLLECADE